MKIADQAKPTGGVKVGFPRTCDICAKAKVNTHLFHGNIELALRPIKGANPSVLLVGQDPTTAKGQIYSVLDLENTSGSLYGYIVTEILEPVDLKLDNIYATDLVKCRFPDNQTPKAISENRMTIKDFLYPFFCNCRQWFFQEVREIHPKIILSFGEPVHQLLIEEFNWAVPTKMKSAFSNTYKVTLLGDNTLYVPCIHIHSKGHSHYKNLWNKFIQNLQKTVNSAGIV